MALLGNHNIFHKNPTTNVGGDSISGIVGLRSNWNRPGDSKNRFYGETWIAGTASKYGLPAGYSAPYGWILPPRDGGLGSNVGITGTGTIVGSGALGRNLVSALDGSGTISNAGLGLILSAVATLTGIGGISGNALGALQASATLAGTGDITGSLGALAGAVATLTGSGTISGTSNAKANLSADIYVNQSTATVNELVAGVWNALAAEFNVAGTMGNKLNGAGSAGDPWTTDLSPYSTPGTAGKIIKQIKSLAAAGL